ncbi:hypothetical protein Bbelb_124850 [Branchiostoma belcheri]|nr:hypothetical protein Bbelb_124850 [Branchiostoma belcheri]
MASSPEPRRIEVPARLVATPLNENNTTNSLGLGEKPCGNLDLTVRRRSHAASGIPVTLPYCRLVYGGLRDCEYVHGKGTEVCVYMYTRRRTDVVLRRYRTTSALPLLLLYLNITVSRTDDMGDRDRPPWSVRSHSWCGKSHLNIRRSLSMPDGTAATLRREEHPDKPVQKTPL